MLAKDLQFMMFTFLFHTCIHAKPHPQNKACWDKSSWICLGSHSEPVGGCRNKHPQMNVLRLIYKFSNSVVFVVHLNAVTFKNHPSCDELNHLSRTRNTCIAVNLIPISWPVSRETAGYPARHHEEQTKKKSCFPVNNIISLLKSVNS